MVPTTLWQGFFFGKSCAICHHKKEKIAHFAAMPKGVKEN
jgi:hypothetical protein